MKILLVDPPLSPYSWNQEPAPPLGLLYLAAAVRQKLFGIQQSHEIHVISLQSVKIFDKEDTDAFVAKTITTFRPDIVGMSTPTPGTLNTLRIAEIVKKLAPKTKIIVGGYQATVDPEGILQNKNIDIAVRGEGEIPFCELTAIMETGDWAKVRHISNIAYRSEEDEIIINSRNKKMANIDFLPFPERQLVQMDLFKTIGNKFRAGGMITSRGCPWKCNFCYSPSLWGKGIYRSANSVVDEIEVLVNEYGITKIRFEDDTFTTDKVRAISISKEIKKRKLTVNWEARTRIDLAEEDMLEAMRSAGLERLQVGIETVKDDSLALYQKGVSFQEYEVFFRKIRKTGLGLIMTTILGIPSETPEQMLNTINWVKEKITEKDKYIRCLYTPFPGTFMDTKYNPIVLSRDLSKYTMDIPLVTSDLFSIEELIQVKHYGDSIMKEKGPHHAIHSSMPNGDQE